ncbi:hypothetical protein H0266_12310 [Halobacillus locisalis]|uniref:Uncharacterized protein n=1 Tax=Halobacillus locisalis TaxID=220753 RepID=A0A838CV85_9BACI|nr:hypothetical protein [Halobacillus locisalis]MBA2175675.1 hypothetical protein [Halobacillus locisalis]
MSGLMGGMMGAMVGSMVHISQLIALTNIFALLLVSSIILYPIFVESDRPISKAWVLKPFIVFLIISAILVGGSSLIHEPVFLHNDGMDH